MNISQSEVAALSQIITFKPHLVLVNNTLTTLRFAQRWCLRSDVYEACTLASWEAPLYLWLETAHLSAV
jgi:hypothetical protein